MRIGNLIVLHLVFLALCSSAPAVTVEVLGTRDSTLMMTPDGSLSSGGTIYFFVGRTNQSAGYDLRRAVIGFNVSSVIPAGSTINSVTLRMRVSRTMTGTNTVKVHRLLADWGEGAVVGQGSGSGQGNPAQPGDATWLHRFYPNVFWNTPGGDFVATPSASRDVGGSGVFYDWTSAGLVQDVQQWVNDPATNFGWIVIGDETYNQSTKRFDSRNHTSIANRPRIVIDYTAPPATGGCCMSSGVCMVMTAAGCATHGGIYQGDNTTCSPNPCPQRTGACCGHMGMCMIMTEAACITEGGTWHGANTTCTPDPCPLVLEKFVDPLPIPPIAQPLSGTPGGAAHYEIAIQQVQQQLHRDLPPTTVWGYAGMYPGPTIEAAADQTVTVKWINDLRDSNGELLKHHYLHVDHCLHGPHKNGDAPHTVVHLHGAHVAADSDGHPEDTILPGENHTYTYPNHQLPATLWYHDHALGITRLNVAMGLAGFYLVRDAYEQALSLPAGEYEIPLAIQDRSFNRDGSLNYPHMWMDHYFGDTILVNGKVWPYLNVKRGKYRFRLLNGSGSRTYTLALSDNAVFHQIGSDGGLLTAPIALNSLTLMPAERADIIIDFANYAAGASIVLTNSAPAPFPGDEVEGKGVGMGMGVVPDVMKFIVQGATGFTAPIPATLRPVQPLLPSQASVQRDFVLRMIADECTGSRWTINELGWDDIREFPQLGATEIWRFINRSSTSHPMHMHLVQFQVLDRQDFYWQDGQAIPTGTAVPPPPNEAGWKDTVQATPNQITRVIAKFENYTGYFAYHCHILEHEDHEMMRQMLVRLPCPADISPHGGDMTVNVNDLLAVINAWGPCPAAPAICSTDITHDQMVNVNDLLAVINSWGACPLSAAPPPPHRH